MSKTPELTVIPDVLAQAVLPWSDSVARAWKMQGDLLRSNVQFGVATIEKYTVATAEMSSCLSKARATSLRLANRLDGFSDGEIERADAIAAMADLKGALHYAEPSEQANAIGVAWR